MTKHMITNTVAHLTIPPCFWVFSACSSKLLISKMVAGSHRHTLNCLFWQKNQLVYMHITSTQIILVTSNSITIELARAIIIELCRSNAFKRTTIYGLSLCECKTKREENLLELF